MQIDIDPNAGFCFGVTNAINKAEAEIAASGQLLCLGEMVHNHEETSRLAQKGMTTISYEDFANMHNTTVLLRAHGEPPSTYNIATQNNITIIDATCPIVLRLHKLIKSNAQAHPGAQTVIYGKKDHAEVVGLVGQVGGDAIVVSDASQIASIDFTRDIMLYSQTTMNHHNYNEIANLISEKLQQTTPTASFNKFDTVCKSVAQREQKLSEYAACHDTVLFVAGANSSNGKYLYHTCCQVNSNTHYITKTADLIPPMLQNSQKIGVTGATSTPKWLLQEVADRAAILLQHEK
ncbi:MAG: 4-hydroxy-3-methylbut-2-enyl diphosphate reductase [Bacteroidales bacterium]|nr:4-hydroxy-3-methylbut-2-enyl diphosphate reductase [Bacteroidales bacterium]